MHSSRVLRCRTHHPSHATTMDPATQPQAQVRQPNRTLITACLALIFVISAAAAALGHQGGHCYGPALTPTPCMHPPAGAHHQGRCSRGPEHRPDNAAIAHAAARCARWRPAARQPVARVAEQAVSLLAQQQKRLSALVLSTLTQHTRDAGLARIAGGGRAA